MGKAPLDTRASYQQRPGPRNCPACESPSLEPYGALGGCAYARCRACRSILRAVEPSPAELEQLYRPDYARARGHGVELAVSRAKQATFRRHLRWLGPGQSRSLLEVGCSAGDGLLAARALGFEVTGIDRNPEAVALANRRLGDERARAVELQSFAPPASPFDAITLFDVLEHLPRVAEQLDTLRRSLRRGGHLLLVTPDATSLSARLFGRRWPHFLAEHLTLFSRAGLRSLLVRSGFEILRHRPALKSLSLAMVRHHFELYPHVAGARLLAALLVPPLERSVPLWAGEQAVLARVAAIAPTAAAGPLRA
jgi:SAM-dependent methyltransferase